jgi:hypothetical protein
MKKLDHVFEQKSISIKSSKKVVHFGAQPIANDEVEAELNNSQK